MGHSLFIPVFQKNTTTTPSSLMNIKLGNFTFACLSLAYGWGFIGANPAPSISFEVFTYPTVFPNNAHRFHRKDAAYVEIFPVQVFPRLIILYYHIPAPQVL